MRRDMSPAMIERAAALIGLDALQGDAADGEAGDEAAERQDAEGEEVDRAHLAGEAALLVDVTADDQLLAAGEGDRDGNGEPLAAAAQRPAHSETRRRRRCRGSPAAAG